MNNYLKLTLFFVGFLFIAITFPGYITMKVLTIAQVFFIFIGVWYFIKKYNQDQLEKAKG